MLEARALDDWPPDYGDWPDIVELLTATILRDDPKFARAEQDITNDALACISALASVRTYIYAAQIQMRRIDEDLASTEYLAYWQAFADIHFYFICWSRVLAMITLVEERSGLSVQAPHQTARNLSAIKPRATTLNTTPNGYRAARVCSVLSPTRWILGICGRR